MAPRRCEADIYFRLRRKGAPVLLVPILILRNEELVRGRGLIKDAVKKIFDAGLIEFLHELGGSYRCARAVADDNQSGYVPICPARDWLL
ncbi:MAG: hypothetical protein CAK90_05445 [Spartobacteria bacterium AMD-G4]|nr:MAG: hypothetical protein CAK90_05445 [Spartobacteria bacterium AMD-G4]